MIEPKASSLTRRRLLLGAAALATLPALQGCFPVVAGGAVAGAAMISDRRSSGAFLEDEAIEWKTRSAIRERFGTNVDVSVVSYNRNVLLVGRVPDQATRSEVGRIASGIDNVNGIVNEVDTGAPRTLTDRSSDSLITSRVKARFVDDQSFRAHHVKVVTADSTVFLMGIVTRREADAATEVARTTQGVQKVVRVFEFVSDDEAARLDRLTSQ